MAACAYAPDETSIRYPPKTVYRRRAETGEDFYVGTRRDVLHPFDGDWKIARRRMLLDQQP
jgi:3-phenylpropionate/cinnamic acid dioxygenase small subunit